MKNTNKIKTSDKWDSVASWWDINMGDGDWFQRNIIYPITISMLKNVDGKKVADIGCGNGHLSRFLGQNGAHAYGFDKSCEMIKVCKSHGDTITYKVCDITKDDVEESSFDVAIFNNSLQDMDDFETGISAAYRILCNGGKLLICVKHPCFHPTSVNMGWKIIKEDGTFCATGPGLTDISNYKGSYAGEYFMISDYLNTSKHCRKWYKEKIVSYSRTISEYVNAVIDCGFTLDHICEPKPLAHGKAENPYLFDLLSRIPNFIFILAEKR